MKPTITKEQIQTFYDHFTLYQDGHEPYFPAYTELEDLVSKDTNLWEIFEHESDTSYDIVQTYDDYPIVTEIKTTREVQKFIQNDMDYYLKEEEQYFQSNIQQEKQGYQKVTKI